MDANWHGGGGQLSGNWHQRMRKHHGTEKSAEHAMCRCEKSAWSFHRLSACHVMKVNKLQDEQLINYIIDKLIQGG